MPLSSIPLQHSLEEARQKIVDLFVDQCANGAQTSALSDSGAAACGQFIGGQAVRLQQRGLHGTAAALRVLSHATHPTHDIRDLLQRLVKYVVDRHTIEVQVPGGVDRGDLEVDSQNVIKQSELLYALSRVPGTITNVDKLRRRLINQLQGGIIHQKGWAYFANTTASEPDLLPTAYAVLALAAVGEDVSQPAAYLLERLKREGSRKRGDLEIGADITIRVACLYALTFRRGGETHDSQTDAMLRKLFADMWSSLERLLRGENIEQNVEYWRERRTFYVRVPWQLYLLALSARLHHWSFASFAAQTRLRSVLSQIAEGHFRYPHSGEMVSSRTNAIAYEVLGRIQGELQRGVIVSPAYWIDRIRGSIWLRRSLVLAAIGVIAYSSWQWLRGGAEVKDLATEFVGPAIIALLALWSKKQ